MDPTTFSDTCWGRLVRTTSGVWAFCPFDLPPKVEMTWPLAARLADAERALGRLAGTAHNLANPHLLIRPFVRREAVLSSRIEGTQSTTADLFQFEAGGDRRTAFDSLPGDVLEVSNYVRALDHGIQRLESLPLSLRFIRELHHILLDGVRGQNQTPGEFRTTQNWIGPSGGNMTDATYVPPPPLEMMRALHAFEEYLHAANGLPPLIRLALLHYQFEAIHPFLDGNGRVGRLLVTLLLIQQGLLPQPLLYLSAYFERRRETYYALLLDVSRRGNWADWIEYFLDGIAEQSTDAVTRMGRLLALQRTYRDRVTGGRASSLLPRLVDDLFERPITTIGRARECLGVSATAATHHLHRLVAAGILEEMPPRGRMRRFAARGILQAIDEPLTGGAPAESLREVPRVPPHVTLSEE